MPTSKPVGDYVFPQKFICKYCKEITAIEGVGVSVQGQIVVFAYCYGCERTMAYYLDYDCLLKATHKYLIEKWREEGAKED